MTQAVTQIKPTYRDVAIADHGGGGKLMPQTFGEVVAFSEIMARAQHAIPKHLRDVPGACLAVTMQAMRWELDPFLVASKSYNVKDIISYEAQLVAAVVHTRAPLKTRPEYEYSGEGVERRCKVSATFEDGISRSYESPRLADIAVKNSPLWKADTDQQLGYYSIRAFARRYCPEVILGVYTPEEAETFRGPDGARDVTPRASLADRLAAGATGEAEPDNGFSEQHVIREIDGQPQAAPEAETQPEHDAGTNQESSAVQPSTDGDAAQTEGAAAASAPGLPADWPKQYAAALRRATKKESLQKLASQFWNQYGGWGSHKDNEPVRAKGNAIFDAFALHFGKTDTINAQLHELGAD